MRRYPFGPRNRDGPAGPGAGGARGSFRLVPFPGAAVAATDSHALHRDRPIRAGIPDRFAARTLRRWSRRRPPAGPWPGPATGGPRRIRPGIGPWPPVPRWRRPWPGLWTCSRAKPSRPSPGPGRCRRRRCPRAAGPAVGHGRSARRIAPAVGRAGGAEVAAPARDGTAAALADCGAPGTMAAALDARMAAGLPCRGHATALARSCGFPEGRPGVDAPKPRPGMAPGLEPDPRASGRAGATIPPGRCGRRPGPAPAPP